MNSEEAKKVLLACRPEAGDRNDPEVCAATADAESDPALKVWWLNQQQIHAALRARAREIPIPAGLKAEILAGHKIDVSPWWRSVAIPMAIAAALVVLLAILSWRPLSEPTNFAHYRDRMVRTVIREYRMDITTGVESDIRSFLKANEGHPDYRVPNAMNEVPHFGVGRLTWQGRPVSMICFERQPRVLMYLFVIDQSAFDRSPGPVPEFQEVADKATASWSDGRRIYLLLSDAGAADLQALIQ